MRDSAEEDARIDRIFETIRKNSDVAFMTGEQILDWYLSVGPKAP